jgi:hypothetical protein
VVLGALSVPVDAQKTLLGAVSSEGAPTLVLINPGGGSGRLSRPQELRRRHVKVAIPATDAFSGRSATWRLKPQ